MKSKIVLWLDDARDPADSRWEITIPQYLDRILVWAKSYEEFIWWIKTNGLPHHIFFDHDINSNEVNGVDAARWLAEYCWTNRQKIPHYSIQSANLVGSENIKSVLETYKRNME